MTLSVFLIIGGLVLLTLGGDWLVRGAVTLAERLGVSPLLIGLTLVGFGTSTPELVTSLQAAFAGSPGIAVGNVVGSNTANILLILGIAALIRPIDVNPAAFFRDSSMTVIAALMCVVAMLLGTMTFPVGLFFVATLVWYVVATYRAERRSRSPSAELHVEEAAELPHARGSTGKALSLLVVGLLLTMLGARWLVSGSIDLARGAGISETVIGLTIVAVGTSLPELVTSVTAAYRGHSDVALGNILGSNIYNVLGILGVTAMIMPIEVPPQIRSVDVWVMLAATGALLVAAWTGRRISRVEGAVFLVLYGLYTAYLAAVGGA